MYRKTESAAEYEAIRLLSVARDQFENSNRSRRKIDLSGTPCSIEKELVLSDRKS